MTKQQAAQRPCLTNKKATAAQFEPISITIPGEPIPWKRAGRNGSKYYDQQVHEKLAWGVAFRRAFNRDPFEIGLKVSLTFYLRVFNSLEQKYKEAMENMPHARKPDGDNCTKFVFDALNGVAWKDDSLIASHEIHKVWSYNPRTHIVIEPLADFR